MFLRPSSPCTGPQVTDSFICVVDAGLHWLSITWPGRVCPIRQPFENPGRRGKTWAFVSWKQDWGDCAENVGGFLHVSSGWLLMRFGAGQDRIRKKAVQNLVFDNPDSMGFGHNPMLYLCLVQWYPEQHCNQEMCTILFFEGIWVTSHFFTLGSSFQRTVLVCGLIPF